MDGATARALLGVDPGASPDTIKQAFRRQAKQWHPDVADVASTERFCRLREARDLLLASPPAPRRRGRWFTARTAAPTCTWSSPDVEPARRPRPRPEPAFADVLAAALRTT